MDITDRAAGALLGMAVGEALGAPIEGLTTEEVLDKVGRVESYLDARRVQPYGRAGYFQRGVYEDETQLALVCADVVIRNGGFKPELFRDRLEELGQPIDGNAFGAFRRARRNFRTSVKRMLKGAPWTETGVNTAGSGAASRGVPIGVYYRDDRDGMVKASVEAALTTHRDPRAVASCAATAAAVAAFLKADPAKVDVKAWCADVAAAARAAEDLAEKDYAAMLAPGSQSCLHDFSDAVSRLPELIELDIEAAFERIIKTAAPRGSRPITSAVRGFALTAVMSSFWFVLTGLESYDATTYDAVSEGGSSDTVGALTGALLGALHGASKIPEPLLAGLKNREQVELRGRILGGAPREGLKSLLLLEAALTRPAPKPKKKGDAKGGRPAKPARGRGAARRPARARQPSARVVLKRVGNWLLASDKEFAPRRLRAQGSQSLAESTRFQSLRSRFSSEQLFVYFDIERAQQGWALVVQQEAEERARAEAAAAANAPPPKP
ncbi:MAG TPA: ADP-ribosylglycohydrolase family protein, partial [Planctomycetota bacterium]|nr:ADP-ribosylglycohydrolase family protein [Planctomycetota bacterium]